MGEVIPSSKAFRASGRRPARRNAAPQSMSARTRSRRDSECSSAFTASASSASPCLPPTTRPWVRSAIPTCRPVPDRRATTSWAAASWRAWRSSPVARAANAASDRHGIGRVATPASLSKWPVTEQVPEGAGGIAAGQMHPSPRVQEHGRFGPHRTLPGWVHLGEGILGTGDVTLLEAGVGQHGGRSHGVELPTEPPSVQGRLGVGCRLGDRSGKEVRPGPQIAQGGQAHDRPTLLDHRLGPVDHDDRSDEIIVRR